MSTAPALTQLDEYRWEIPRTGSMRVPGRIYADRAMIRAAEQENTWTQVANVAHLPGIVRYSIALPDMHWGYGFPIGGVAATDPERHGVVSPGGIGYDINCGVRLMRTNLFHRDIREHLPRLLAALFSRIPVGVGSTSSMHLSTKEMSRVLSQGAAWAVSRGFGAPADLEHCEDRGTMPGADPDQVSDAARTRGRRQLGTLGAGNHFLELGVVDEVYDQGTAAVFDLQSGQVTVLIHTGSRGLGHQVCDDYLAVMHRAVSRYHLDLPDRQLTCAPLHSPEGRQYIEAMACAANFAWANRQLLLHAVREICEPMLHLSTKELGMELVYDVCHNVGKYETHAVQGRPRRLFVHRKGATRAFPAGHPQVPSVYRHVGQPVLVPGDMGTASYVMVGLPGAAQETWGSACHGAGRVLSRSRARGTSTGSSVSHELREHGILVMARGKNTLVEEMPQAYKDVDQVVRIVHHAGLARPVVRLRPLAVIKG